MTETGFGITSVLRRYHVGTAVQHRRASRLLPFAMLAVLSPEAATAADAWNAFQARCLEPALTGEPVQMAGLDFVDVTSDGQGTSIERFAPPGGGFGMSVMSVAGQGQAGCGLGFDPGASQAEQDGFAAGFRGWAKGAVARGEFAPRDEPGGSLLRPEIALRREMGQAPGLLVTLWRDVATGAPSASVRETGSDG